MLQVKNDKGLPLYPGWIIKSWLLLSRRHVKRKYTNDYCLTLTFDSQSESLTHLIYRNISPHEPFLMPTGYRFQYPYTKLFLDRRRAEQQFALYKWFMTNLDLLIVTNECVVLPRSRRLDMRLVQFPPIWALTNTETKWQIFALLQIW